MRSKAPFKRFPDGLRHMRHGLKTGVSLPFLLQRPEHRPLRPGPGLQVHMDPRQPPGLPFRSGCKKARGKPFRKSRLHIVIPGNAPLVNPARRQKTVHQSVLEPVEPAPAAHDGAVMRVFSYFLPVRTAVHHRAHRHVKTLPVQAAHQPGENFLRPSPGQGFHQEQDFQTGTRHKTGF